MSIRKTLLPALFLLISYQSGAQPLSWIPRKNPYKWMLGIGWNVVDDDGRAFCQPFDAKQSWNYQLYPTRLNADFYLRKGLSIEFTGCYNQYKAGKLINDSTNVSGLFLSFDANVKYSFYSFFLPSKWFDPYVSLGLGGTHRDTYETTFQPTFNAAIGANFWIYRGLGIQIQTSGKFGITGDFYSTHADYLQHTAGFVYKFQPRRRVNNDFSKKHFSKKVKAKSRGRR